MEHSTEIEWGKVTGNCRLVTFITSQLICNAWSCMKLTGRKPLCCNMLQQWITLYCTFCPASDNTVCKTAVPSCTFHSHAARLLFNCLQVTLFSFGRFTNGNIILMLLFCHLARRLRGILFFTGEEFPRFTIILSRSIVDALCLRIT